MKLLSNIFESCLRCKTFLHDWMLQNTNVTSNEVLHVLISWHECSCSEFQSVCFLKHLCLHPFYLLLFLWFSFQTDTQHTNPLIHPKRNTNTGNGLHSDVVMNIGDVLDSSRNLVHYIRILNWLHWCFSTHQVHLQVFIKEVMLMCFTLCFVVTDTCQGTKVDLFCIIVARWPKMILYKERNKHG